MKIAILGTGNVGTTLGTKLLRVGHEVTLGSRSADNEAALAWLGSVPGSSAQVATFADACRGSELIFNCTAGVASLAALHLAGAENLKGKVLIDVSNPLDFSAGFPPTLSVCNDASLGEQIQAAFPEARVVKTLNTISCHVMVEPSKVPGPHVVFLSGNDAEAKELVRTEILIRSFGWAEILDLGDITTARGTEMYLPLWVRIFKQLGTGDFNVSLTRADR